MPFGLPVEGIELGTADVLGAGEAVAPEALGVDLQTYVRQDRCLALRSIIIL